MIAIKDRILGVPVKRIWYWKAGDDFGKGCQIIRLIRVTEKDKISLKENNKADIVYTLVSNLSINEERLWSELNKNYKYEIRRAEKEGIVCEVFDSEALVENRKVLIDFKKIYSSFADQLKNKQVKKAFDEKKINSYIVNHCILLTRAYKNEAIVYHMYVFDKDTATLCYSASDFRNKIVDSALAGRMNKYLHWEDIKYLKKIGIKIYDWGNVSNAEPEKYNGIDRFKAGFGGVKKELYNITLANGLIGKLVMKIVG